MSTKIKCYSAGPGLFPRVLPNGECETWADAQIRVRAQDQTIAASGYFEVITPSNAGLAAWDHPFRPRACMLTDLLYATHAPVVFADVTPMGGGPEPDSGTVTEAVACALSGGILTLWSNPLTTFTQKYADNPYVRPHSELDTHYNLMLEQLFYWSWDSHFEHHVTVFDSLETAVAATEQQIKIHGAEPVSLLDRLDAFGSLDYLDDSVRTLLHL